MLKMKAAAQAIRHYCIWFGCLDFEHQRLPKLEGTLIQGFLHAKAATHAAAIESITHMRQGQPWDHGQKFGIGAADVSLSLVAGGKVGQAHFSLPS